MLTAEENEVLCRVGPGTPMGNVLRRFWTPAFQLGDLPAPDCPPIRVTILGENFVAFRDTNGRLGVLDELCCHRGASLTLGRVEECGLRCLYHGWKYAVDGTIMETPNLATSTFRERVKHGAYPVREAGGLGWIYLGPPGSEPPFPSFGWASDDNAPRIEVENTPFGFHYAAIRDVSGDPSKKFVRITAFAMPYTAFIGGSSGAVIVVPRDDYTCSSIGVFKLPPGSGGAVAAQRARRGVDPAVWGPEPGNRRLRLPPQDRQAMAEGKSFAGFRGGNRVQDAAVQMSSGKIYDRAKEHLVPADLAIIRLRRLLADSIRLVEAGQDPLGLGEGCDFTQIGAASKIIDAGQPWQDLVPAHQGVREPAARSGS